MLNHTTEPEPLSWSLKFNEEFSFDETYDSGDEEVEVGSGSDDEVCIAKGFSVWTYRPNPAHCVDSEGISDSGSSATSQISSASAARSNATSASSATVLSQPSFNQPSASYLSQLFKKSREDVGPISLEKAQQLTTLTESSATVSSRLSFISSFTYLKINAETNGSPAVQDSFSPVQYSTAPSYLSCDIYGEVHRSKRPVLGVEWEHPTRARAAGLSGDRFDELDWSGSGMHIQLPANAEMPFTVEHEIARTARAVISSVVCRRVRLARKTMLCHRRFTAEEAFEEVKHLHKLQHSHIVRLVGSYVQARHLSILTYPVATFDLDAYMRLKNDHNISEGRACALGRSFGCLISALSHVHESGIKHMDIKPKNILIDVQRMTGMMGGYNTGHRIHLYLTDFGISRTIVDDLSTETDGPVGKTEMYCSPEVAAGEAKGRSSDIFSLGCVFAEMFTVIFGHTLDDFEEARTDDGTSFYRNQELVMGWLTSITSGYASKQDMSCLCYGKPRSLYHPFEGTLQRMLDLDKTVRPAAVELNSRYFEKCEFCKAGPPRFRHCLPNPCNGVVTSHIASIKEIKSGRLGGPGLYSRPNHTGGEFQFRAVFR